ncbi:MAG: hypothetical protein GF331_11660 [Chitinivibrionales bacterium]|nr:hypothetical protein [Chitinivibrionales bacterium]
MTKRGKTLIFVIAVTVVSAVLNGCAESDTAMSPTDSGDPHSFPTPRTGSILPLQLGNEWAYSDTRYDSSGTIEHSRAEYNVAISRAYGKTPSDSLIPLDWQSSVPDTPYDYYVYGREVEAVGRGTLLAYLDVDVDTPGVYLIGTFTKTAVSPYASPVLWLAYPAAREMTYQCTHGSSHVTVTVVSTDTSFYFPDRLAGSTAPVRFVSSCYLYREDDSGGTTYRYFHKEYGELGGLRYEHGRLVLSYALTLYALH